MRIKNNFFVLVFILIYFSGIVSGTIYAVSDSQLKQGIEKIISKEDKLRFEFYDKDYFLELVNCSSYSAEIIISSESLKINLSEEKNFDLNSDGIYDLSVKLDLSGVDKAGFYLQKLSSNISVVEDEENETFLIGEREYIFEFADKYKVILIPSLILWILFMLVIIINLKLSKRKRQIESPKNVSNHFAYHNLEREKEKRIELEKRREELKKEQERKLEEQKKLQEKLLREKRLKNKESYEKEKLKKEKEKREIELKRLRFEREKKLAFERFQREEKRKEQNRFREEERIKEKLLREKILLEKKLEEQKKVEEKREQNKKEIKEEPEENLDEIKADLERAQKLEKVEEKKEKKKIEKEINEEEPKKKIAEKKVKEKKEEVDEESEDVKEIGSRFSWE